MNFTLNEPRHRVGIVTDSAAGLRPSLVARWESELDFRYVELPLMIGDQIYPQGTDPHLPERLAIATAENRRMSTSRPSPGSLLRAYAELADQGVTEILSIHLPERISGTLETARQCAGQAQVPVTVIDAKTLCMAQGYAVAAALQDAVSGASAEEIRQRVENSVAQSSLLFYIPHLDALARSGRIPKGLAMVGQMLQVKPIGTVVDGRLKYVERPRQEEVAQKRLEELVLHQVRRCVEVHETFDGSGSGPHAVVNVQDFFAQQLGQRIAQRTIEEFGGRIAVLSSPLPAVLALHSGLGTLAFSIAPAALAGWDLLSPTEQF